MFEQLEGKKNLLKNWRNERREVLVQMKMQLDFEWTYQEMAFSGTPLARMDVRRMIESRHAPHTRARQLREAYNFYHATHYMNRWVILSPAEFNEKALFYLQSMLTSGLGDAYVGARYRSDDIVKLREPGVVIPVSQLTTAMAALFRSIRTNHHLHPVRQAVNAYAGLMHIQPFGVMNGRLARLVMNLILMQHGFSPALLTGESRESYEAAFEQVRHDGGAALVRLVVQAVESSLDFCVQVLERAHISVSS